MQRKTESLRDPFLSPEFAVAVDNVRPDARVAVLAEGPDIVGFFPFQHRLGVGVPIGAGLNNCQGLIHAPAVEWDPRALLRACKVSVWQFDHLVDGQQPFERYRTAVAPSPVIDLTDGFAAYQEKLRVKSAKFCRQEKPWPPRLSTSGAGRCSRAGSPHTTRGSADDLPDSSTFS
jgi:hypothetical protein